MAKFNVVLWPPIPSYLLLCPAASLVRAPFQIGGFKSAINVRRPPVLRRRRRRLSDPMIFAICDRCYRNSGVGERKRGEGNLLGKREKPLVCPPPRPKPDVNQQSERASERGTGRLRIGSVWKERERRGMILSSKVQKHPQSHTAVSGARSSIPMETEGEQADHLPPSLPSSLPPSLDPLTDSANTVATSPSLAWPHSALSGSGAI